MIIIYNKTKYVPYVHIIYCNTVYIYNIYVLQKNSLMMESFVTLIVRPIFKAHGFPVFPRGCAVRWRFNDWTWISPSTGKVTPVVSRSFSHQYRYSHCNPQIYRFDPICCLQWRISSVPSKKLPAPCPIPLGQPGWLSLLIHDLL